MTVLDLLDPQKLRCALRSVDSSRKECINLARLVAAYYLGFPLFTIENTYPSLFLWTEISAEDLPNRATPITREYLAAQLPPEYSPRFPAVLLVNCGFEVEAVLYSDHFNDRRSSLLLRLLADSSLSLSLTDSYIFDVFVDVLPKHIDRLLENRQHLYSTVEVLSSNLVQSLIELDVVLARDYLIAFENQLIDQVELLFAELPLQAEDTSSLPRPPVYSLPEAGLSDTGETTIHIKIHIYIRVLLQLLHKSNRLTSEIGKALSAVTESRDNERPYSILLRIAVVVLTIVYRDGFSLAVAQEWSNLPEVALKYKSLLPDENGDDHEAIKRWKSLASDEDMRHLDTFFQYLRENYTGESKLPPLSPFTRDMWYKNLLERGDTQGPDTRQNDWLTGVIQLTNKVDSDTFDRMQFVANGWTSLNLFDPGLVSIRLGLSPSELCSAKPSASHHLPARICNSARQSSPQDSPVSERVFTAREDLVTVYARKGREYLAQKQMSEKKRNKDRGVRYLKNTLREGIDQVVSTQKTIERELDEERTFLDDLGSSSLASKSSQLGIATHNHPQLHQMWDEAIRNDLNRLNQKLDTISRQMRGSTGSSLQSHKTETDEESEDRDRFECLSNELVEELDEPSFNYSEVADVAEEMPEMERLDFSILSPLPSVGNRIHSSQHKTKTLAEHNPNAVPDWMKLLPMDKTVSARPRLLNNTFREKVAKSSTERSVQTDSVPSAKEPPKMDATSATEPKPLQKIGGFKTMSKEEIAKLLRSST